MLFRSVDIWGSNWIPRAGAQRPLGRKCETDAAKVVDLLDSEGTSWNVDKLHQIFYDFDVNDIKKISVGGVGTEDYHAWNFTKNGIFSVRSAYHLCMKLRRIRAGGAESSTLADAHKGWLALWSAPVPGKVKIHVWRLMRNGLAVGSELQHRNIKRGIVCVACGREENVLHRFWQCPHSQFVWEIINSLGASHGAVPPGDVRTSRDLQQWFLEWLGKVHDSELDTAMMTLYHLWLSRNEARDSQQMEDPGVLAKRVINLTEEWRNIQEAKTPKPPVQTEHWLPPQAGWTKINADGAMTRSSGVGGGGVVARDHHGSFIAAACHFFKPVADPYEAELRACRRAVSLAKELNLNRVVLETDSLGVVSKLTNPEIGRAHV